MYSDQPLDNKEAGRNFSNHVWHGPPKTPVREISVNRYRSSLPPCTPKSTSTESSVNESINNNHYPKRTQDTSEAKDYRDKLHPTGNQEFRDKSYPQKKDSRKRTTNNPTRTHHQSSQIMHAHNVKQHKQIKNRMVKKLNQQGVELGQKDQEVALMVTEVKRLQRGVNATTVELQNTKVKIKNHFRYISAILKTGRMLQAKNLAMKDLVSGLAALRKENKQQKERILELAYHCKN